MRLLSENGNQRKFNISVKELLKKPIHTPACQRSVMIDHVMEIVNFQRDYFSKKYHYIFLNCIQFCIVLGVWYCVDGQHRYEALKELNDLDDWTIDIEITYCKDKEEMHNIFRILNTSTPVPEFLKSEDSVLTLLDGLKKYIHERYPKYISPSSKPQRPNIQLDTLISEINRLFKMTPPPLPILIEWFETENAKHCEYLTNSTNELCINVLERVNKTVRSRSEPKNVTLRSEPKLYLGCYWLDKIPNKILKTTRDMCWKQWHIECQKVNKANGFEAPCYVCEKMLDHTTFEAGHIEPHTKGGLNTLDNLRPVCGGCNKTMGTMNMDEFKAIYGK
uniref:HNH nuclease domain-containing protein n=1 Tax=viral metagenome TaxID=1070528 RepID=A0A6C0HRQ5_9ZZZZ